MGDAHAEGAKEEHTHHHHHHEVARWVPDEAQILEDQELRRQNQRRRRLRIIMFCMLLLVTVAIIITIMTLMESKIIREEPYINKADKEFWTTEARTALSHTSTTLTPAPHDNASDERVKFKVVIVVRPMSLDKARKYCSKEKALGNILYVENVDEDRALPRLLEEAKRTWNESELDACHQNILIGVTSVREKKWRSIDGKHYIPSIDLSPDYGLEDTQCVILKPPTFQPVNASCHDAYACWICVNNCTTQPCYSLHYHSGRQLLTFYQAERSCFNDTVGGRFGFVSALGISKAQQAFIERKTSVESPFCRNKPIMTRSVLPGNAYEVQMTPHNGTDELSTFLVDDIIVELPFVPALLDHPNDFNCFAISLVDNYTWKQVTCDTAMCFACRVPPSYHQMRYNDELLFKEDNLDAEWYNYKLGNNEPMNWGEYEEYEGEYDEEDEYKGPNLRVFVPSSKKKTPV